MLINVRLVLAFLLIDISLVKGGPPKTKEEAIIRGRQRFGGFDNARDYEYEILTGHKKQDFDKFKRQKGCMCVDHFYDPHCGSDFKTYDNGCYFLCGQTRQPGLKLLVWGPCPVDELENNSLDVDAKADGESDSDFDYEYDTLESSS